MPWTDSKTTWDQFIGFLSPGPGEKILDVGAGRGKVPSMILAVSKDSEVYAVDPDKGLVAAIQRDFPALKAQTGRAEDLPFPDSEFDKVYSTLALTTSKTSAARLGRFQGS